MFDLLAQNATAIIGILGALAFMVVIMVELTKELPLVKKVPTKLWTIIVSMVVCIAAVIIYFAITAAPLYWYYIALAFFWRIYRSVYCYVRLGEHKGLIRKI